MDHFNEYIKKFFTNENSVYLTNNAFISFVHKTIQPITDVFQK